MANKIPEKLINFRVYLDAVDLLGVADVTLPSLEAMTDTVRGAGIAGEIDSPVLGHFGSMACTLNWRTTTRNHAALAEQKRHNLTVRGAIQQLDAGDGTYKAVPCKVVLGGVPKKTDLGKFEVGAAQDASTELEVTYIKLVLDGENMIELDKLNYIYAVRGVDQMAGIRTALGLD